MHPSLFQHLADLHRCILALLLAIYLPALAQPGQTPRRVALVIDSAAYDDKPLVNPVDETSGMAAE